MVKKIKISENDIKSMVKKALTEYWQRRPVHYSDDDRLELVKDPNIKDGGNFGIKRNGKEYWVSRSNAITLYVYCKDQNGEWNILCSQRGSGAKYSGKWNVVSGFLDYGETLENAAVRECWEETGIKINKNTLRCLGTDSTRTYDAVNTNYYCILNGITDEYPVSSANAEEGEIEQVLWLPISRVPEFSWGLKQGTKILQIIKNYGSNNAIITIKNLFSEKEITEDQYIQIIKILQNGKTN